MSHKDVTEVTINPLSLSVSAFIHKGIMEQKERKKRKKIKIKKRVRFFPVPEVWSTFRKTERQS